MAKLLAIALGAPSSQAKDKGEPSELQGGALDRPDLQGRGKGCRIGIRTLDV